MEGRPQLSGGVNGRQTIFLNPPSQMINLTDVMF